MPYIKKVEGEALSRTAPTVQLTSVARKPKWRADPDVWRQPPAPIPQADIHAPPVSSIRPHLDNGHGLQIFRTVLHFPLT